MLRLFVSDPDKLAGILYVPNAKLLYCIDQSIRRRPRNTWLKLCCERFYEIKTKKYIIIVEWHYIRILPAITTSAPATADSVVSCAVHWYNPPWWDLTGPRDSLGWGAWRGLPSCAQLMVTPPPRPPWTEQFRWPVPPVPIIYNCKRMSRDVFIEDLRQTKYWDMSLRYENFCKVCVHRWLLE